MVASHPLRALGVLLVTALALALPAAPAAAKPCKYENVMPSEGNLAQARHAVRCLINKERVRRGRARVRPSRTLRTPAQRYAESMVRHGFFDHVTPGGRTLVDRIRATPVSYVQRARRWALGENLAWGSGHRATPRETVIAWMHSPGHKRNIIDKRFRHIGVGIAEGAPTDVGGQAAATYTTEFGRRSR